MKGMLYYYKVFYPKDLFGGTTCANTVNEQRDSIGTEKRSKQLFEF